MGGGGTSAREFSYRSDDGHTAGSVDMDGLRNAPQPEHDRNCAQHAEANDSPNDNQDDIKSSAGWRGNGRGWGQGNLPSGSCADGWHRREASWHAATLAKSRVGRQLGPALRTKTSHGSSSRNWRLYITLVREEPGIPSKPTASMERERKARFDCRESCLATTDFRVSASITSGSELRVG